MKNLTRLVCNLISIGSQLSDSSVTDDQLISSATYHLAHRLPEDCDVNIDDVAAHIKSCRNAMKGSDFDIDDIRRRLAQGQVVSAGEILNHTQLGVKDVVEFHGKFTVKLSNGRNVTFLSGDVTHY